jgi:hypothetical protein
MFVAQSTTRYGEFCYLCEIGYSIQDLFPFFRFTFIQHEPCNMYADVCEVVCCECHITQSKYVISWICDHSDISVVGIKGLIRLLIDGFHMNVNDYNDVNVIFYKIFIRNNEQIFVIL